jgi:glycosyltransferase involved in cell wall biosynthesis
MKVLHIIKGLGRGGAETLLPETLRLHNHHAFEFHYLYFLPWKDQLVGALRERGGHVTCLPAKNNIQIILQVWAVVRYIRKHQIQVVHAHLPWAGIVSRLVHKLIGIPVIYTEHNKYERYHVLTRWMNKLTFRWQTLVVAVSDDVATSIKKNIDTAVSVRTVLNGVDTECFQRNDTQGAELRRQLGLPADAVVIGTVAVFREQKRLQAWLQVVAQVVQSTPNVYALLVGDGPERGALESLRRELGLAQRLIMPGLQQEVRPFYSVIDIFLMTSLFEGLPLALLEAMSMSCAVATTDAGGIKEVVTDGVEGRIVVVDQWPALAAIVKELAQDRESRRALALAARTRVIRQFSLAGMVSQLESIYREVEFNDHTGRHTR